MRKLVLCGLLAGSLGAVSPAGATTILNLVDRPPTQLPIYSTFVATKSTTTVIFGGYELPSFEQVTGISITAFGDTTNLAQPNWTYTPAPAGHYANPFYFPPGNLIGFEFGGTVIKSFDLFSQDIPTVVDTTYTLLFLYTQDDFGPNGLKVVVDETVAEVAAKSVQPNVSTAVPEASTWVMMLAGFASIGLALRGRRALSLGAKPA